MAIDFDKPIHCEGTNSVKFDGRQHYFGTTDVTPLWVADMDFAAPDCVQQALQERIQHPVFGYTFYPESLYQSIIDWFQRQHNWHIDRSWILMAPGVVPSLFAAVQAVTKTDDAVIVQPPVYFPFFTSVTTNNKSYC
jgi:cysteine-S-conjugate beta-lyase